MAAAMIINSFDYIQCFRVDADMPVDALLKQGIFRTFELLYKKYPSKADQIRLAVGNALKTLSQVDACITSNQRKSRQSKEQTFGVAFFSGMKGRLVEFLPGKGAGKFKVRGHGMDKLPTAKPKPSEKQQTNTAFKSNLLKVVDLYAIDTVERVLLEGVFFVLQRSEDFGGPFIEMFRQQQPLFVKLREVYEQSNLSSLDSTRGDYNEALAVDAFAASEDVGEGGVLL